MHKQGHIGKRLRRLRLSRGRGRRTSQAMLARRCGTLATHISKVERGQRLPTFKMLAEYAKARRLTRAEYREYLDLLVQAKGVNPDLGE